MSTDGARSVLLVTNSMGGGGAERVTANLAEHWAARGWSVTVLTMTPTGGDFYRLPPAVQRIGLDLAGQSPNALAGLWQNVQRVVGVRRALRAVRPEVAIGLMTTPNIVLAVAALGLGIPVVGSEHIHPPQGPLGPLWEGLRRHTYRFLRSLVALTDESAAWFERHTSARRLHVIPNAAPWPLPAQAGPLDPATHCAPGRRILLGAGRLEAQKGFDSLIDAFGRLAARHPDWDLVIVGEGSWRARLEAQRAAAGLEQRVALPGRVGNLGDWYQRADLFALSSRFEGFGNTLAEALTYGVPAVSFACESGPSSILRHEVDGLLVPPDDVAALTAALDRMMASPELRRACAARAVEARDRYSPRRVAELWEAVLDEATGRRTGRA